MDLRRKDGPVREEAKKTADEVRQEGRQKLGVTKQRGKEPTAPLAFAKSN